MQSLTRILARTPFVSMFMKPTTFQPTIFQTPINTSFNLIQSMGFRRVLSRAKTKRLPLTTKKARKGYYKGNGARKEGRITSKGKFLRVRAMCTELIVPDLTDFPLKPYIGAGAKRNLTDVNVKV